MSGRSWVALAALMVSTVVGACSGAPPTSSLSPSPTVPPTPTLPSAPPAASFDEFATEACSAFAAMQRAIGNPDTGEGSDLVNELNAAVQAGDAGAAGRAAMEIKAELEVGRQHAAAAGGWEPAARMMAALDRFLRAYQVMVGASLDQATRGDTSADPQQALEQAGGVEAWMDMFEAYPDVIAARPTGRPPRQCPGVPIGF